MNSSGKANPLGTSPVDDQRPDGTKEPEPERPEGVPAEADYHQQHDHWAAGAVLADQRKDGRWRYWSGDGKLVEDTTYVNGVKYGPSKVFGSKTAMAYAVAGAAGLRGDYERGIRVGVWHVLGADGKRLMSRDFGICVSESDLRDSPALANQRRSAFEWSAVAESFARERRFGEAVVSRARSAARSASINGFLAAFAELSLPTTPEGAEAVAAGALADNDLPTTFSGLLLGGSPALLCQALSIWADKAEFCLTALDLINAALLITPENKDFLATRALVLDHLGLHEQAQIDRADAGASEKGAASSAPTRPLHEEHSSDR